MRTLQICALVALFFAARPATAGSCEDDCRQQRTDCIVDAREAGLPTSRCEAPYRACLAACPRTPTDRTPPALLDVGVRVVRRDGSTPPIDAISILGTDVHRWISRDYVIRITATAGDLESSIASIELATTVGTQPYNYGWACFGTGVFKASTLWPMPPIAVPGNRPFAQIDVTVDPVRQVPLEPNGSSCSLQTLNGFIRVIARNGAGQAVQSGTFLFDFVVP